ncbi:MAG TPA: Clp protease N-terminal domain-containing protein [Vicinamibacterales bacterium]|jgi:ATP-dependent Clp protease ATP-binding subunit ClpA
MFERYTERARRTLFFARYEASQTGSHAIESEHLLLGIAHDRRGIAGKILEGAGLSYESLLRMIHPQAAAAPVSTSIELPFSPEVKRVLNGAVQEADQLGHDSIGNQHLLVALCGERDSKAARLLNERGLTSDAVRQQIAKPAESDEPEQTTVKMLVQTEPGVHLAMKRLDDIQAATAWLAQNVENRTDKAVLRRRAALNSIAGHIESLREFLKAYPSRG